MRLIRSFIACSLPRSVVDELQRCQLRLAEAWPSERSGLRWARPSSFHLTFRFLGEIDEALLGPLEKALRTELAAARSFEFRLGALGCFPEPAHAQVLWAGATGEGLASTHAAVGRALLSLGIPEEPRPFQPHVTLARLPRQQDLGGLLASAAPLNADAVTVSEVVVYSSELATGGARYHALRHAPLGPESPKESVDGQGSGT